VTRAGSNGKILITTGVPKQESESANQTGERWN